MAKKPMCPMMPAEATGGEAVMYMNADESVLILLQHCRDMKQQETRLRLTTLLLLFTCAALFFFGTCTQLRRQHQGSDNAAMESPGYSRQEKLCPAEHNQTEASRMRVHLMSVVDTSPDAETCMTWSPRIGHHYNDQNRSIVIPDMGVYFVYMKFDLFCPDRTTGSSKFQVALKRWNRGYGPMTELAKEHSSVDCSKDMRQSVFFVGQLFDLFQGDHLSVWIQQGYNLISMSSFGVFLV